MLYQMGFLFRLVDDRNGKGGNKADRFGSLVEASKGT